MGKIIFLDVDGTLVDYENKLPESAVKAVRKAREKGSRVYICTGRSRAEIPDWLWEIGLDGMIGGNGSYVEDNGNVVMHQTLSYEQTKKAVDWLHEQGLEFYLESNNGLFASENFEEKGRTVIQEYSRRKGREDYKKADVRNSFHGIVFGADLYRDDLNKISFILDSYQNYLDAKEVFPDLEVNTWGGKGETALFGDMGVKDIKKSTAVKKLLEYLNRDVKDTIAFGDAKIDIPMLECCEIGVAMGNGGEEIKAMADYITDDVENDGLYKAFVHFGLI